MMGPSRASCGWGPRHVELVSLKQSSLRQCRGDSMRAVNYCLTVTVLAQYFGASFKLEPGYRLRNLSNESYAWMDRALQ
jgi:hypothetical protein